MSTQTILYIIISGIIALAIALFQYWYKMRKNKINYILAAFRFLALFFIMLLLINPSVKKSILEIERPNLLIAVDQSSSIKYTNQEGTVKSIVEKLKTSEKLNEKFNLQYFGFGKELYPLDSLIFDESQTNISKPIQEFSKIYKENSPVLIVTDGNQTVGNSIEFLKYKSPVNAFIVGDTTVVEDIYISRLNVNKQTYLKNQLPVELFVNYTGVKPISKHLKILHKGKIVYSEQINLSKENNVYTTSFHIKASEKGTQFYTATIGTLASEKNKTNNSKSFSIDVVEEKMKILLLSDIVHPDLGMLKKSIESNQQREVTIKNTNQLKGDDLDYQLVVLFQPTANFKTVYEKILRTKQHFFVINGLQTDWDFLNQIQPYFKKNAINQIENYLPKINLQYESFVTEDIGFNLFSPLEDIFGEVSFNVPAKVLLQKKIGVIETKSPMLATFEADELKAGVLFGENMWRWRMQSYIQNKNFKQFDDFISNLILYLASKKNKNRLQVSVNPIYFANETVQFSATYVDNNLSFDNRVKLWLSIRNKDNNQLSKIPFALSNNTFLAELSNLNAGEYKYTVFAENQNVSYSGVFKIQPFEIEQQFLNANDNSLKIIATRTGGKVYYSSDADKVVNDLIISEQYKSIQTSTIKKTPLINWKWFLALIVFFLSAEWFTRKYYGKI